MDGLVLKTVPVLSKDLVDKTRDKWKLHTQTQVKKSWRMAPGNEVIVSPLKGQKDCHRYIRRVAHSELWKVAYTMKVRICWSEEVVMSVVPSGVLETDIRPTSMATFGRSYHCA